MMNAFNTKLSKGLTMVFLAINWTVMILLSAYFLNDQSETKSKVVLTLVIGFVLQMAFISNQLKTWKTKTRQNEKVN